MAGPTEQLAYFAWENKYNEFKALLVTLNPSQVNALNFRGMAHKIVVDVEKHVCDAE